MTTTNKFWDISHIWKRVIGKLKFSPIRAKDYSPVPINIPEKIAPDEIILPTQELYEKTQRTSDEIITSNPENNMEHVKSILLHFTKHYDLPYQALNSNKKRIHNDISSFAIQVGENITEEMINAKMRPYGIPYQIVFEGNKFHVELETFRIPEMGFFKYNNPNY